MLNKEDIFKKLEELELDKDKYIIISGASLVVQDFLEETSDINLSCSKTYYDNINWPVTIGKLDKEIKYKDCFEISNNLYDNKNIIEINGYKFMNLEKCYDLKKQLNRKKDKKLIEKLDQYLCNIDNLRYEKQLYQQGLTLVAGVDEVGRGPLIGPVVAACVILPKNYNLKGLTDSKKLSEKKREYFYNIIKHDAISYGVGIISNDIIDEVNIYEATKLAMYEAIKKLKVKPEHILIDAMPLELDIPTTSIIKGDMKSITISAASVIAKVERDHMMIELDQKYPMYNFKNNKGYPTKDHIKAINEYGILENHRKTYGPVHNYITNKK